MHRDHRARPRGRVRATWVKVPDRRSRHRVLQSSVLLIEGLGGFSSASLLVDLRRAVSSATFDSFDAMERNQDQSNALKATSLREAGGEELDEYGSAGAAHLRVPGTGLINPPAAIAGRPDWAGTVIVRRAALAVGIARLSRLEEGIWWDRWRHGALPRREGRSCTLSHH